MGGRPPDDVYGEASLIGLERGEVTSPLSGLSGASIRLVRRPAGDWLVRKMARSPERNDRLRAQLRKQRAFLELPDLPVRLPRILDEGERDGVFYFDMEYVRGVDGASFLRRAGFDDIRGFAERLSRFVRFSSSCPVAGRVESRSPFQALYGKVCDVQNRTRAIPDGVLVRIFLGLERLARLEHLEGTLCHGDLTLENLIVDETGSVWVLDLLDPPFEHWWQDVAKLQQDLEGGWYLRGGAPVGLSITQYLSSRLLASAVEISPVYAEVHDVLLAANFVRILPYVTSPLDRQFVLDRIEHFAARL